MESRETVSGTDLMTNLHRSLCRHDSMRADGTLDCNCLRCGADGYWHDGHRHDEDHPSGKVLIRLSCLDARAKGLEHG